jgi:D-alanyl-D-alanine carboxypeptidase
MTYLLRFFLIVLLFNRCSLYVTDLQISQCAQPGTNNSTYSKASELQQIGADIVRQGVPGFAIAVYSPEGSWASAEGFAKIEDKTAMRTCHLQYLQSISKTYMAVGILKLYEQGKLQLDTPMNHFLPSRYSRYITDAKKITIRMLLNHTSGIPEYNSDPGYISRLLQQPDHIFSPEDYLKYIEGKPLDFAPGSKYAYRNTNYVILALIADAVTGDHAKFLSEVIFQPLGLTNTFYRNDPGYLKYPNLVNSYWDRHSNSVIENVSQLQRNNVQALVGDDGIVATPGDAVKFLKGLMEGQLLSLSTLEEMKSWVKDPKGNVKYGLGLDHATFQGHNAYGHSGGGIGAGCQLYYFPEKNLYVFIGINLGTVTDSPIHKQASPTIDKLYEVLLK